MDCLEFMTTLPDESVDLIVTDPPYNDLSMFRGGLGNTGKCLGSHGWFANDQVPEEQFNIFFLAVLAELHRVLKPHSHFYCFCNYKISERFKNLIVSSGFNFVNLLVWDKLRMGLGWTYRNQYELIILASKGKNKIKVMSKGNVLRFARVANNRFIKTHPTQKLESIMSELIANSSQEGDLVFDPFAGSGTTLVAAAKLNRRFLGCEIAPQYVEVANCRLAQLYPSSILEQKAQNG